TPVAMLHEFSMAWFMSCMASRSLVITPDVMESMASIARLNAKALATPTALAAMFRIRPMNSSALMKEKLPMYMLMPPQPPFTDGGVMWIGVIVVMRLRMTMFPPVTTPMEAVL